MRLPTLLAATVAVTALVAAPAVAGVATAPTADAAVRAPHSDWLLAADSAADTVSVFDAARPRPPTTRPPWSPRTASTR